MSGKVPTLSAFFPAYNDAESLASFIEKTFAALTRHAEQFEVIVVNDGSQDGTTGVLRQLCSRFGPDLRVVEHPQNGSGANAD